MNEKLEKIIVRVLMIILLGTSVALMGCAAGGAHCITSCKEGPAEYNKSARWVCIFDEGVSGGNMSPYRKTEQMSSVCALKIAGSMKNVDSTFGGKYQTERECFENFCIPRLAEICGNEDRCANVKNWFDRPGARKYYGF